MIDGASASQRHWNSPERQHVPLSLYRARASFAAISVHLSGPPFFINDNCAAQHFPSPDQSVPVGDSVSQSPDNIKRHQTEAAEVLGCLRPVGPCSSGSPTWCTEKLFISEIGCRWVHDLRLGSVFLVRWPVLNLPSQMLKVAPLMKKYNLDRPQKTGSVGEKKKKGKPIVKIHESPKDLNSWKAGQPERRARLSFMREG